MPMVTMAMTEAGVGLRFGRQQHGDTAQTKQEQFSDVTHLYFS